MALEPCGHETNFQIGDDHGNFHCLMCEVQSMLSEVQKIQPGGSPPYGGPVQLTKWIVSETLRKIENLKSDNAQLRQENDQFRAMLGNSAKPCIYCGLSAKDQIKCESGFPGCARADDQMLCPHFAAEMKAEQRIAELGKDYRVRFETISPYRNEWLDESSGVFVSFERVKDQFDWLSENYKNRNVRIQQRFKASEWEDM